MQLYMKKPRCHIEVMKWKQPRMMLATERTRLSNLRAVKELRREKEPGESEYSARMIVF